LWSGLGVLTGHKGGFGCASRGRLEKGLPDQTKGSNKKNSVLQKERHWGDEHPIRRGAKAMTAGKQRDGSRLPLALWPS